ncbi:DUF2231 domain-containing protein [Ignavibacterium sp.]|uniref:DUF2231 domain-containing protein n=1 Tax=Ignavibacterium sp. TaxID=2651167 RepID=UPI00307E544A
MESLAELHHKIVHFPIALLFIYPFVELMSFFIKKEFFSFASFIILIIGVSSSVLAVLTGNQAANSLGDTSAEIKILFDNHQNYANITVWMFTAILFSRIYLQIKKKYSGLMKIILLIISFAGCYFIFQTGDYGGKTAHGRMEKVTNNSE